MAFEPQKFFIGMLDFFSIFLPGALLTFVIQQQCDAASVGLAHYPDGVEGWIVFLFASYLLGHFVFLLGAWLLDDLLYDPIRCGTYKQQIKRLAEGRRRSLFLFRWIAAVLVKSATDQAQAEAIAIKERHLQVLNASKAVNAFQWAKAKLTFEDERVLASVHRFEADSKFFRSFVVVLALIVPYFWQHHPRPLIATSFIVLFVVLAFCRYVDQRVKATSQAYWYVITMEAEKSSASQAKGANADPSRAGGVVIRCKNKQRQYLLVEASKSPHTLVLPKGHVERLERLPETAVREVQEETGVWARVMGDLEVSAYTIGTEEIRVQFYLMEYLVQAKSREKRRHEWLTYEDAINRAAFPETRLALEEAEKRASIE
jgi:8-oxo-dGTP pyrophosphatase MutT (NUDIX family)